MKIRLLMSIMIATTLGACSSQQVITKAMTTNKNFGVRLDPKPNPAPGRVNILSKAQGNSSTGKKNGFVGYARGEQGLTIFFIKNEDPANTCASGANWVITQLRLASQGNSTTEKGSNFGTGQDAWLALAFPGVNLSNGVLFPQSAGPQETTMLPVFAANQQSGRKNVYYEISLKPCGGDEDDVITTDPMWFNGGKR